MNDIANISDRSPVVLTQKRKGSDYNDLVGLLYHFPAKYLNLLQGESKRFVYYDPDSATYFGSGVLTRVFEDKKSHGHYFGHLEGYKPFIDEVPFRDTHGSSRESSPSYNPQNAARRLTNDEFVGICLDGGILLNFEADAHLIKVLGEELIASEVVGLLELVKNAFDAQAEHCRVRIEKIPSLPALPDNECEFPSLDGPVIIVEDDGSGMSVADIQLGWMRPASVQKTNVKEQLKRERRLALERGSVGTYEALIKELKSKHGGRIPLGEKGVGRFASHRLGQHLIVTSKTAESNYESVLETDWRQFDRSASEGPINLRDLNTRLTRRPPSRDYGTKGSGTRLVISGGRPGFELTPNALKEINRSLLRLQSPQKAPGSFSVEFQCPQLTDLDETPIADKFEPSFTVDALIRESGEADIDWVFSPPRSVPLSPESHTEKQIDLRNDERHWGGDAELRAPRCGAFYIHMDIWYRSKPWIDGPHVSDFRDHLDDFGGISIYRDGLNILPSDWGTKVDWLKLSKRHIKKNINMSYYNFIGNLEIDQTQNFELTDKTDREGLLENQAFGDLSALTRALILRMENNFKAKRDQLKKLTSGIVREPKELEEHVSAAAGLLDRIVERYDLVRDASNVLDQFGPAEGRRDRLLSLRESLASLKSSLEAMEEVQDQLTEQAGYGLALGVAVHEVAKITSNFYTGLVKALKSDIPDRALLEPLKDSAHSLKQELKRFGPFRAVRNEKPTTFDILRSVRFVSAVFEQKANKKGIVLQITGNGFSVFARYGAVNQVISNLYDNAIYWAAMSKHTPKVVRVVLDSDNRCIIVADSGDGIAQGILPYLFEAGYSLKHPPSGLGLYICKYYMRHMNGDIYQCPKQMAEDDLLGAQFCLDFSRVKESA